MSNNNNRVWQDLTGTHEELSLGDWAFMENRWGEFGEPGFTQTIHTLNSPGLTGIQGTVDSTWVRYRGEDGALLGVYFYHIVDGIQKPILLIIHPDHQRQGIGTRIADYVSSKYKEEHGTEFTYEESYGTLSSSFITTPTANFVNKYVKNIYGQ